jgi:DNA polymerase I-like protein with 3'-5' exonuclease and polymerase domains
MPEIAFTTPDGFRMVETGYPCLGEWLADNLNPADGEIALDFEASGRHVDGNWATEPSKCEPPARVSIAAMSWLDTHSNALMSCAIPFDQGFVGGKQGRYIAKPTKRNPKVGWELIEHTNTCALMDDTLMYPHTPCTCAPWNFGTQGWRDLVDMWRGDKIKRIDYFNFKYDAWIALAGLRPGNDNPCGPECVGWQHQAGPDGTCLNAGVDLSSKLGTDVMIVEGIREPAERASLDHVSRKFFGTTKDRGIEEGLKANGVGLGKRYDLVSWVIAGKYAAKDAELTLRAKHKINRIIEAGEIDDKDLPIIKREHRKAVVLFKMEQRGVGFNVDLCREQGVKMHAEVDKLVTELPFKDTNIAAGNYFFGEPPTGLGILPIKLTDGGKPSCDAEVVARLTHEKGKAGEVAKLWQHIANMKSVCSKWYDAWPNRAGADGRLRTNFFQFAIETDRKDMTSGGAISGRLSATRVQLQGVPQAWRIPDGIVGIKKLFQPKPGHQLWEFDASNAEVRVTAWLTQCQALATVINSGVNIHSANTVNIFAHYLAGSWPGGWPEGMPHDAFKHRDGEGWTRDIGEALFDKDGDPVYVMSEHPEWKKVRTSMKRGIFGTIYASGVRTLKSQIDNDLKDDIPERQIRSFMDALNAAYPEIKRTSKACERKVDVAQGGPGYVRLVSGRRRVFGWGERTYKALNACVQGGVAEMMSELMLAVEERWPGMLVNQVHDSLWLEIPDELVDEVGRWVKAEGKRLFESAFQTKTLKVAFKFDGARLA